MAADPNTTASRQGASASGATLYRLLRQIRPTYRALVRVLEGHLASTGMTRPMRAVLELLVEQGALTVPQLARALAVRRQFVQRVVNELVADGLAERRTNSAHRRSWLIVATAKGRERFEVLHRRERAEIERVGARFDEARVETAIEVLEQLEREARALDPASDAIASRDD